MPPVYGYTPIDLKNFGSLCTLLDPTNLPIYLSPDCANVEYFPGLVRTRPGLTNPLSIVTGIPSVNYLKTYINQLLQARLLVLDSDGTLYREFPQGTLTPIGTIEHPECYGNSTSLFSKEYIAFGDQIFGTAIPRQYDDVNLDRVSQVGPGAGPTVADFLPIPATISNPGVGAAKTISTLIQDGLVETQYNTTIDGEVITFSDFYYTLVNVVTAIPHGFSDGQSVAISGTSVGYIFDTNGAVGPITVTSATGFTYPWYSASFGPPTSGTGGTATPFTGSVARVGNVLTISTAAAHGFKNGWTVVLAGITPVATGGAVTANRTSGLTTLTTATVHHLPVGSLIVVAGFAVDPTFNGQFIVDGTPTPTTLTFSQAEADSTDTGGTVASIVNGQYQIQSVPSDTTFTVQSVGNDFQSSPSGATATIIGNVAAGKHQVSVSFITREGYITRPSPPVSFVAGGGSLVAVSNIPIGPDNVQYRLLMFTPLLVPTATLGSFYSLLPAMKILDNTTTSAIVDFTDNLLLTGELQDYLFELDELPESAGVTEYNSRLVWWGIRNNLQNFDNLTFDGGGGGAVGGFPATYPLGWTRDPVFGTGGQVGAGGIFGSDWEMYGNGIDDTRGMITQNAYQDVFGARRLEENTSYSVRVRVAKQAGITRGNVVLDIYVPSTLAVLGTFTVPYASITTDFLEFTGVLLTAHPAIPQDAVLRIYATGNPNNLKALIAENIELFRTDFPFLTTDAWLSQVELPENYASTGLISIAPENGQSIRCAFRIRNYLYFVKESSLYVTSDNPGTEPDQWDVNEVSATVGTPSPRGVGIGDEWVVIAGKSGLYFFEGNTITESSKFSNEIQPTWDRINWEVGQLLDVKVDTARKRIYVAVPLDDAMIPDKMLVLDYVEGWGDPLTNEGRGRKWTSWDIPCNSMNLVIRPDTGHQPLFIGNNVDNGKIYELSSDATSDDGAAINGYWQSGFFQNNTRMNFGYVIANIVGNGTCNLIQRSGGQMWLKQLRGWRLNRQGFNNMERQIQADASRMAIRFGTNAVDHWFSLQGASVFVQSSMWSVVRGVNSRAS